MTLRFRDRTKMMLSTPNSGKLIFDILDVFPFTSESEWMGTVVGSLVYLEQCSPGALPRVACYSSC